MDIIDSAASRLLMQLYALYSIQSYAYTHLFKHISIQSGAIRQQLNSFLDGFYDVIPKRLISIFNEQEIELLMSGLPTFDIDDLKTNTEYHKYQTNSLQVGTKYLMLYLYELVEYRVRTIPILCK